MIAGEELKPSLDELLHYGVKGMRWGVRREDVKTHTISLPDIKLKNGETIRAVGDKVPVLARFVGRMSSRFNEKLKKSSTYTLRDSSNKSIGELSLLRESDTSMNIVWVGVDKSVRGKGVGTAVMKASIAEARRQKLKTVTLEVPGNAPDARHIYGKLGFTVDKVQSANSSSAEDDPVWGGLTSMTLRLNSKKIKHGALDPHDATGIGNAMDEHSGPNAEFLAHFGVKGMRWGQRKKVTAGDIRAARKRLEPKAEALANQYVRMKDQRRGTAKAAKEKKAYDALHAAYLRNPDRATAVRMTRGEKATVAALGVISGPIGIGVAGGAIATRSVVARRIEYKQENKLYKKK